MKNDLCFFVKYEKIQNWLYVPAIESPTGNGVYDVVSDKYYAPDLDYLKQTLGSSLDGFHLSGLWVDYYSRTYPLEEISSGCVHQRGKFPYCEVYSSDKKKVLDKIEFLICRNVDVEFMPLVMN